MAHPGARMLLVAAIASGQGKTTVTAALARGLVRQGQRVRVFKCGPDFIDPMLLERACGSTVHTLDLWMVGLDACRRRLAEAAREADVVLIEGVMGLYDGNPSAADLSRAFGIPVLAVIDASSMAQTAGAVVQGLRDYGPVQLAGVVANRVASEGHRQMVAASLRDVPLLATLPKQARPLPERHLGLVLPGEVDGIDAILDELADQLHLRHRRLAGDRAAPARAPRPGHAGRAAAGRADGGDRARRRLLLHLSRQPGRAAAPRRPAALLFAAGRRAGAGKDADAVWLPGGYPELHLEALSRAAHWRDSIRAAHAAGRPILAECGGMMAVSESITDQDGHCWPMPALLPGRVFMQQRLGGLGSQGMPTAAGELRGHTFHYSRLDTGLQPAAHAVKHPSGAQGEAVYRLGSLTATYFHGFFASNPQAAARLLTREAS
jgi:cobyrinic acid a,c-diamide synthase